MSFRLKTILGIALIEILMLGALVLSGLHYLRVTNEEQLLHRAESAAKLFATMTADAAVANDLATLDVMVEQALANRGMVYVRVRNASGDVLAEDGDIDALASPFRPDVSVKEANDDDRFDVSHPIEVAGQLFGSVEVGVDSTSVGTIVGQARSWMLAVAAIEIVLVALFSFVLGTMLTGQLSRIQLGARQVAAGNLDYRIDVVGKDELADTATSFNAMAESLTLQARDLEAARAEAEAGRARAESTLADAIESLTLGVLIADADGRVLHINGALVDLYRTVDVDITAARDLGEVARVTRPLIVGHVDHALDDGQTDGTQRTLELIDGRRYLHTRRLMSSGGIVFVTADISAVYEAEERARNLEVELMQSQKLESLGTLAGGIAHEINTPIQYIGDNLRFLEQVCGDYEAVLGAHMALAAFLADRDEWTSAELKRHVSRLLDHCRTLMEEKDFEFLSAEGPVAVRQSIEGVEHVASIVRAMKEFSHPTSKEMAPVDLNRVVKRAVAVCSSEWKHVAEMELALEEDLPTVMGLEGELNQVVLNLIVNAAQAIGEKGGAGRITVTTTSASGVVTLSIHDTGGGIPAEIRNHVFDPFFTTKEVGKGTGQGLAIARDIIVNKHAGNIQFDSIPGTGTEFTITLNRANPTADAPRPYAGARERREDEGMNAMNTPPTKLRVLFVDDDVSLLNALRRTLHSMRAEWTMTFVESGERALAHLDEHGADVLVSDMRMPGMDGAQLLAEVSRRHPSVIRFVLSGFANNEIVTRAVATSHQYLDKPCNPELLIDAVRRSLALRNLLQDERLRGFVTGLRTLPSRLDVYEKFIAEIDRPAATTATIAAIIESDVALAAKVLKMANSAYFAVPAHVTECRQAVQLLGLDTLRGVIALSSFLAEFADTPDLAQAVERLGRRSLEIGMLARDIMAAEGGDRDACSQACTAGLLAHVGTLLLLANHPDAFRTAGRICDDDGISIVVAERMVLGATHAELGAYLLGLWGFPDPVVEAVAYHHVPADLGSAKFCTASAVHAAQAVVCDSCFTDKDGAPIHAHLDVAYLRALDKVTRIPHWRQLFTQRPTDGGQP